MLLVPGCVLVGVGGHSPAQLILDGFRVLRVRHVQPQGLALGVNQVVGRGRANGAEPPAFIRSGELQHVLGVVKPKHRPPLLADQPPQRGGHGGGYFPAPVRSQGVALPAAEHPTVARCRELLRLRNQVNVPVVCLLGIIAPGEEAMVDQHHAVQVGRFLHRQPYKLR